MDAPPYSAAAVDVLRLPAGATERDRVAVDEPLEIRLAGRPVAVTMRTPGHDDELARGHCLSEGLKPRDARLPDDLAANRAAVAGCPVLVAVGAPSSLAVDLAADRGVTLCGFVRAGSVNVYTESWRISG